MRRNISIILHFLVYLIAFWLVLAWSNEITSDSFIAASVIAFIVLLVFLYLAEVRWNTIRWFYIGKFVLSKLDKLLKPVIPLSPTQTLITQFRYENAVFYTDLINPLPSVSIQTPGDQDAPPRPALIAVMPGYAAIYPKTLLMREVITFNQDNIRWMGRAQSIENNIREITLDVEVNYRWYSITIQIDPARMRQLARALVRLLPANLATLDSRRRPNTRKLSEAAYPTAGTLNTLIDAEQTVHLYSTPLWLVVLRNGMVVAEIALNTIKNVHMPRSDCLNFQRRVRHGYLRWPKPKRLPDILRLSPDSGEG